MGGRRISRALVQRANPTTTTGLSFNFVSPIRTHSYEIQDGRLLFRGTKVWYASGFSEEGASGPRFEFRVIKLVAVSVIEGASEHDAVPQSWVRMCLARGARWKSRRNGEQFRLITSSEHGCDFDETGLCPVQFIESDRRSACGRLAPLRHSVCVTRGEDTNCEDEINCAHTHAPNP